MQCYTLNQRTLLLLIALVAMLLVLSFSGGYYSGLRNAPKPPPPRALKEELLTAFLEAPASEAQRELEVIAEIDPPSEPTKPLSAIPAAEPRAERPEATPIRLTPPPPAMGVATTAPLEATSSEPPPTAQPVPPPRESDIPPEPTVEPTPAPAPAPAPAPSPLEPPIVGYAVQVGSFSEPRYAEASAKRWRRGGHPAFVYLTTNASGRRWHTVRIGFFKRRDEAAAMAEQLREEEGRQAVTVPLLVMPEGMENR